MGRFGALRFDGRGFPPSLTLAPTVRRKQYCPMDPSLTVRLGPDPRFGMLAPVAAVQTVVTPSGLTSTTTDSRTMTVANPNDPFSELTAQTDTVVVNGQTFESSYNAGAHAITSTSAAARSATTTLDALGRNSIVQKSGVDATHYTYDLRGRLSTISQGQSNRQLHVR